MHKGVLSPNMAITLARFIPVIFLFNFYFEIACGNAFSSVTKSTETRNSQTYIIHVNQPVGRVFTESEDLDSWYNSFLPPTTVSSDEQQPQMLYTYHNVLSGFAARLTEEDVRAMEEKDGFVSAHPERILHPQTTHTPHFLGLYPKFGFWKESNFGKGVIIGVLDTGIFPSHPSFSDAGMPPPPAKWKGGCEFNVSVCNNKLIGARSFNIAAKAMKGETAEAPIDEDGHGTHTSSTAAGGFVKNANALGNAKGTAVGMADRKSVV